MQALSILKLIIVLCDQFLYKKLDINHYPSDDQIVDIFTKPLGVSWFQSFKIKLMILPKPGESIRYNFVYALKLDIC